MSITLVLRPTDTGSILETDYDNQNGLISANEVPNLSFLTDWESVSTAPLLKQGVYIYHNGSTYLSSENEAISGTLSQGLNYIKLTPTGSILTAEWITDITGFFYRANSAGIYNSSDEQVLPDICYLDGSNYVRGRCYGMDFNNYHLANGSIFKTGTIFNTGDIINNGDIENTGNIENTGDVNTGALYLTNTPIRKTLTLSGAGGSTVNITDIGWLYVVSSSIYGLQHYSSVSGWEWILNPGQNYICGGGMIYSTGSNLRFIKNITSTVTCEYYIIQ